MESRSVTCYPQPGKAKALLLCEAFAAGVRAAGGDAEVCTAIPAQLRPGIPVFYGVRPAWAHLWEQAKAEKRDWYFIDNSYFDCVREKQFRVTRNAMQHEGTGRSDGKRFAELGIELKPWREQGGHIVVCQQSDEFMRVCAGWQGSWLDQTVAVLRKCTARPLRIRHWNPDKGEASATLQHDLVGAWALVTHSSAAAIAALIAGIPATATGEFGARQMTSVSAAYIERPIFPSDAIRRSVFEVLSDNQWTPEEMAAGDAWKALRA